MRFGINTMQRETLFPAGLSSSEAVAHLSAIEHAELARSLYTRGFDPIELSGDLTLFLPHTFAQPAIERLQEYREESGVTYTVHLPLWSVEPSTPLTPVRQGSMRALSDSIAATRPLEPEVYVVHATGALAAEFCRMNLPDLPKNMLLKQFQDHARQTLQAILEETGLPNRRLAIETIEFPFELTLELAEALDLSICLDTGHILAGFSGALDLFDVVNQCLPRLAEIHLHDAPWQGPERHVGYGTDHQALGKGDLDVGRLLDTLETAGFTGPLIFELSLNQALESLAVIQAVRSRAAK